MYAETQSDACTQITNYDAMYAHCKINCGCNIIVKWVNVFLTKIGFSVYVQFCQLLQSRRGPVWPNLPYCHKERLCLVNNSIQFYSIHLHANLTAKGQLQSEHVKKYRNETHSNKAKMIQLMLSKFK
jgi:hypothetical protein